MFYDWKPYVPVAQRRINAQKQLAKLQKKGQPITPIVIEGRTIAKTFWGKAWCENLECYGDYANRLPRGRTYVRNGSVVHLQIGTGAIDAWVSGSALYSVNVKIATLAKPRWNRLVQDCAGQVDSLIELLQGRLSQSVMQRMCKQHEGLFPAPKEIRFECSCPDWAGMCKHVAAVLYGVGARLDQEPALLFALRAVNEQDLIAHACSGLTGPAKKKPTRARLLDPNDLADVFGVELADVGPLKQPAPPNNAAAKRSVQAGAHITRAKKRGSRKRSTTKRTTSRSSTRPDNRVSTARRKHRAATDE